MRQSTKRLFSIFVSLAFLVAALIVYFNLTKPVFDEIQQVRGDQAARQEVLKTQENAVAQVKKLLGTYQAQAQFQAAVSAALPLVPDVSTILAHVAAVSSANRITLQSVSLLPATVEARNVNSAASSTSSLVGPASSFLLQVKATGTYEAFKLFAKDLENDVRLMDVQSVDITPAGKPNQDLFSYNLQIKVYYQNAVESAPAPKQ